MDIIAYALALKKSKINVVRKYDRIDFAYSTNAKSTSKVALTKGVWVMFLCYDFDQSSPYNSNITLTFNVPNSYSDANPAVLVDTRIPSDIYHKPTCVCPIVLNVTSNTEHQLSIKPDLGAVNGRYYRFYRTYMKIGD